MNNVEDRGDAALHAETKRIYVEQHKNYLIDMSLFDRHYKMAVKPASYGLPGKFFEGATVADVGCGNSAYFEKAMFDLGAKHITCIDIGTDWMPLLDGALQQLGVPRSFYTMISGSTTAVPCPDNSFDFVASYGVIMHLADMNEAAVAMAELCRITAPRGAMYLHVGVAQPALMDKYILPAFRQAYQNEPDFKAYIDGITPEGVKRDLADYYTIIKENDPSIDVEVLDRLFSLFTLHTSTFIQNALQAPRQLSPILSAAWADEQFKKAGFEDVRIVPEQYWIRSDIRKFLAPFHFGRGKRLTRMFYGEGHTKMTGRKP